MNVNQLLARITRNDDNSYNNNNVTTCTDDNMNIHAFEKEIMFNCI